MTWFGPDVVWPSHSEDRWNELLDLARAKGWSLETFSAHRFGALHCPTDECYFPPIDKSASGTESFAKNKKRLIERCPHSDSDQRQHAQRVVHHLDIGERLAAGARTLIARNARLEEVEDLWTEADKNLNAADEAAVENALEVAQWWADEHARQAAETLAEANLPEEQGVPQVVEAADAQVAEADEALESVSPLYAEHPALKERRDNLAEQLDDIRMKVSSDPVDRHTE